MKTKFSIKSIWIYFFFLAFIPGVFDSCNLQQGKNENKSDRTKEKKSVNYIRGTVHQLPGIKLVLTRVAGHELIPVDTIISDINGTFTYNFRKNAAIGMYRLIPFDNYAEQESAGMEYHIDLFYNMEDIEFVTSYKFPVDSMKIHHSEENKIYYAFLKSYPHEKKQLEILWQLKKYFPKSDEFYSEIKKKYTGVQANIRKSARDIFSNHPDLLVSRYIQSFVQEFPPFDLSYGEEKNFFVSRFLSHVDFADTMLLNTDLFSTMALGYIKLYHDPELNNSAQNKLYRCAVDSIVLRSLKSLKIYHYVLEYLLTGFEEANNDEVLVYIMDKYLKDKTCGDNRTVVNIRKRLEGLKKLRLNSPAPDICIPDVNGKMIRLGQIKSDYTVLVFWASWCPHCREFLPGLKKMYDVQKNRKFEVLAISLDSIKSEWTWFINSGNFNWLNGSDLKGWDGEAVARYFVYATPTIFLLDKDKKIIARPQSAELISLLSKLK